MASVACECVKRLVSKSLNKVRRTETYKRTLLWNELIKIECSSHKKQNYAGRTDRNGAENDDSIKDLFSTLGFACTLTPQPRDVKYTVKDIMNDLEATRDKLDDTTDIFACWLMSHGVKGHIVDSFGGNLPLNEAIKLFNENNCPQMKGKPKLFFIQACQIDHNETQVGSDRWHCHIPDLYPDLFISFSAPPGFFSYRDPESGSYFVKILNKVFRSEAEESNGRIELTKVMTRVARNAAQGEIRRKGEEKEVKAMPCNLSTLRRSVVFTKRG